MIEGAGGVEVPKALFYVKLKFPTIPKLLNSV